MRRKTYTKPSFRYERVFETRALSCGKIQITQFQCFFNRRTLQLPLLPTETP